MPPRAVLAGLLLVPFVLAGYAAAGPLRRYLDRGRTRVAVLVVAALSAALLIFRAMRVNSQVTAAFLDCYLRQQISPPQGLA